MQKTITAENITIAAATYDGTAQTPNVIVKDGETTLTKDIDYEITQQSEEMINANCYQITITGKGFYKGEVNCEITIDPKPLTSESINVQDIASKTYTGEALTPEVIVTDGEKILVGNTDYEVKLPEGGCTDANDYQININGKGNYTGTIERTFTITAASPTAVGEQNADKVSVSTNGTSIVISNAPIGAAYKVTTVGGQSIANGIAKCEKETINITQSGIYIVTINGASYKVAK
ncbi:MAG: hypothetical protein J6Y82_04960 [Bacteroidales bacterium]|nr:hypothetical protein [Bacteroidales bacterium]